MPWPAPGRRRAWSDIPAGCAGSHAPAGGGGGEPGRDRDGTGAFTGGAAFVDGALVPLAQAKISLFDWGFTRSDATYDVASVWKGAFFRLDDHIDRFFASLAKLRMQIPHDRTS